MIYLAHTAHCQFLGLLFGFLAWLFIVTTTGINEWRLWYVDDVSVITSGVAWVGIWRVCFYSHVLSEAENCRGIGVSDSFVPAEIPSAQVLMMLAVITGLLGNVSGAVAVRFAYFSVEDRRNMRLSFMVAGALYSVTAMLSLVPLVWNMASVLNNSTIDFPPEFNLPVAPVRQSVGAAIGMGMFASILMLISGVIFFCYRQSSQTEDPLSGHWTVPTLPRKSELPKGDSQAMDNPGFYSEERL
ncbi:PREDICTED: claudin-34 [Poecilia mexicana]|nr:PREDICTED: claudin-34 [Poecilia mexicana]